MLPLAQILEHHNITYHACADDTQLYISVSPVEVINKRMCQHFLQLNTVKTEILVFAAVRVLTNTKKVEHYITPVLKSLHWRPVSQMIDFKILLQVFKALLLQVWSPARIFLSLRASTARWTVILYTSVQWYRLCYGQGTTVNVIWGSLPLLLDILQLVSPGSSLKRAVIGSIHHVSIQVPSTFSSSHRSYRLWCTFFFVPTHIHTCPTEFSSCVNSSFSEYAQPVIPSRLPRLEELRCDSMFSFESRERVA